MSQRSAAMVVEEEDSSSDVEEDDNEHEPPKYQKNQRVFCPEQANYLYEAVVRKTSFSKNNSWTYYVHFLGWNTRWDKWVEEHLLREPTDELRSQAAAQELEAKKVREATKLANLEKKRKKRDDSNDGNGAGRGGKRRADGTTGTTTSHASNNVWEDYCELPFTLKTILIDERERIMRINNQNPKAGVDTDFEPGYWRPPRDVHNLPASVTIKTVLNHFVKVKKKEVLASSEPAAAPSDNEIAVKAKAFVESLSQLFEEALPVCLLYHPERAQYMTIHSDPLLKSMRMTEIYGCEFLLRLFVRLPTILHHSLSATAAGNKEMGQQLQDLIVLLQKNRQACFKAKYREPKRPDELNDYEKALCGISKQQQTTTTTVPMED